MRARWNCSRFMRMATISVRCSWCIFPISPPTIHATAARWTALSWNVVSWPRKTSAIFSPRRGHVWRQGPWFCLNRQISRVEQGVAGHPGIQSDAHEPGPERLSGEPLLQPGRSHAERRGTLKPRTAVENCSLNGQGTISSDAAQSELAAVVLQPYLLYSYIRRKVVIDSN